MRNDKENVIVDLTFEFSLKIIELSEDLRERGKYEMTTQVFRSGTSIGASIREAQNAESKADFIHKFKIAAKEQWALTGNSKTFSVPLRTEDR